MRSRAITVMAVLSGALVTGGWLVERGLHGARQSVDGARLLDDVMTHVARDFVDTLRTDSLYQLAVDGMLYELHDPHSVFLSPERLGRLTESTTGNYGGLGVQIDVRDGWITIIAPLPGSPAERAGIQTGDRIIEIDGRTTRGLTPDEATKTLRGTPGSAVELLVERPGMETHLPFKLHRRTIHTRAVQRVAMLRPAIGYVDVAVFSDSTAAEVAQAVDSLRKQGMRSLVVDLRSNPGGLLDQGVSVSDLFLDPGQEIVSMRGRTPDANRTFSDRAAQRWPDLPIVVLVDEGSASASEIVAGALQDHDRAVIVGETSFGKGSAQTLFPMSGGGALKLTTALWYTPVGRSINVRSRGAHEDDAADDGDDEAEDAPDVTGDTVPLSRRERFRTDGGRIVYGGGAITPDVIVSDSAVQERAIALQRDLGKDLPKFRDALTSYALSLKGSRAVTSRDFTVTPAMRDELYRGMAQRGVSMTRPVYDQHRQILDELLSYEVARYVFGTDAEFLRTANDDATVAQALALLDGVSGRAVLLERATARQVAQQQEQAAHDSVAARDTAARDTAPRDTAPR